MRQTVLFATLLAAIGGCSPTAVRPPPPAAFIFPRELKALGTEPFWSLDIDGAEVAYSTPDQPDKRSARVTRRESGGALLLTGELAGQAIAVTVTPESCSDGMSDRVYAYVVKLRLGTQALQGCASHGFPGGPG